MGPRGVSQKGLDPSDIRSPDVLMCLKLKANGEVVRQDPARQIPGGKLVVGGGKEDRVGPLFEFLTNNVAAPFVVGTGNDDELELVMRLREVQVPPVKGFGLTTVGSLDVDDFNDLFGNTV